MSYPGGKSGCGVYHTLAREIPPHDERLVPFLGRCAILRNIRPAAVNIGVEIDPDVLAQWTDDERRGIDLRHGDGVEFLRWRFGLNSWPASTREPLTPSALLAALYGPGRTDAAHGDTGSRPVPFIFADPPYPADTCTNGCPYRFGFSDDQHAELLDVLHRVPALVLIVSYPNQLYAQRLQGWRTFRYRAYTRRGTRIEQAWCNYPKPLVLHDWRFAGKDRRQRERIARRARNWRRIFAKMPAAERAAILAELVEAQETGARAASIYAGVCSRCLTVNPADVAECIVCRHTQRRPVRQRVFR